MGQARSHQSNEVVPSSSLLLNEKISPDRETRKGPFRSILGDFRPRKLNEMGSLAPVGQWSTGDPTVVTS
jgi:hypothetical protein